MKSQQEYMKNVSTIYLFSQFLLNFPSMPFSSDFRMLIPQQSSTTPVRPAESINTKTEVFFMRELRNTKIIAVDHGYGNMKTANTVTPTEIKAYEPEPIFTGNILEYNGIYYRIGEGHKEFKVVSRGSGRSAVAASAYMSCSRMYNDYDGIQHDYTRKQGLIYQEVMLPPMAPLEWNDREQLWNAVEETEKTKDSRLAREFVVALPVELDKDSNISLLQDFIKKIL